MLYSARETQRNELCSGLHAAARGQTAGEKNKFKRQDELQCSDGRHMEQHTRLCYAVFQLSQLGTVGFSSFASSPFCFCLLLLKSASHFPPQVAGLARRGKLPLRCHLR